MGYSFLAKRIYEWIYIFHMPVFVFLSGYFVNLNLDIKIYFKKILINIIFPLVIFELIYESFNFLVLGGLSGYLKALAPYWILWYLLSLFSWYLLLPLYNSLRFPLALLLAVIVTLVAGYVGSIGMQFSLSRTLYFFPFFLCGYYFSTSGLRKKFNNQFIVNKILALSFFVFLFVLVYVKSGIQVSVLYGSSAYEQGLGLYPMLNRFLLLVVGLVSSVALLNIFPFGLKYLEKWGKNSLIIFLLHPLFLKIISHFSFFIKCRDFNGFWILVVLLITSLCVCILLSRDCLQIKLRDFCAWIYGKICHGNVL